MCYLLDSMGAILMFLNIFNIKDIKCIFSDIFNSYVDFETYIQFSSVQSLSRVRLFATPWIGARQASLSITN